MRLMQRNGDDEIQRDDELFTHHRNDGTASQFNSNYEVLVRNAPRVMNDTSGAEKYRNPNGVEQDICATKLGAYEFSPKSLDSGEDDYDYDTPYWAPSNEEKELLLQLKKLRIPSVRNEDLQ